MAAISVYGRFNFQRLTNPFKLLTLLVFAVLVSECVNLYLEKTIGTNFPSMHVFSFVGIIFNGLIYFQILKKKKQNRIVVIGVTVIAIILLILNLVYLQGFFEFPSNGLSITVIQVVIFVFLTYVKLLNNSHKGAIYTQSIFWLNSGNFLFYGITFFIFSFFNHFYKAESAQWIYDLIKYANFAMYLFFFIAIYLNKKETDE